MIAIERTYYPKRNKQLIWLLFGILFYSQLYSQNTVEKLVIRNVESLNTKALEYSPVLLGNQLIFTSTRPTINQPMTRWRDEKEQFSDLYIADKSAYGGFINVRRLPGKASSPVHDGVATVNHQGNELFFTRNNANGKNEDNVINLKIYALQLVNDVWQNLQELPFNDDAYSNCHPYLTTDGQWLYFASNRPGGFGGMDLYVSRNINGVWQKPQNLGHEINSDQNEVFPFLSTSNMLYFASNNEQSRGGLDLFKSKKLDNALHFSPIENLGPEFNSTADDFGYFATANELEGYFSSNRPDGKGEDDLYHWQRSWVQLAPDQLDIIVFDGKTKERVANATITIFDGGIETTDNDIYPIAHLQHLNTQQSQNPYLALEQKQFQTGTKGKISMITTPYKDYTIFIEKEGFLSLKKVITVEELRNQKEWKLELERKAGIPLHINALTIPFREKIPFVRLALYNKTTRQMEQAISDETGQFTFYLDCNCQYELVSKKEQYRPYQKQFSTQYGHCDQLNAINTQLFLVKQEIVEHIASSEHLRFPNFDAYFNQSVQKVGQIIVLDGVQFAENKANLTNATKEELYKVHFLIQNNPNLSIELSAHTDSRGTAKFNHRLSQKRADAMLQFLLHLGVPKEQITAVGYGEDKLLNHCKDGVRCSESEHLQNKRVELTILKVNQLKNGQLLGQR
ncbi:MAG: OmpA family protein [Bacteroidota bacterium]